MYTTHTIHTIRLILKTFVQGANQSLIFVEDSVGKDGPNESLIHFLLPKTKRKQYHKKEEGREENHMNILLFRNDKIGKSNFFVAKTSLYWLKMTLS